MLLDLSLDAVAVYVIDASFVLIPVGLLAWWLAVVIVPPERTGIYEVLGEYRGQLDLGIHLVWPFVSTVTIVDCRRQVFEAFDWTFETRGGKTVSGDLEAEFRVTDPEAAHFEVEDYEVAFWNALYDSVEAAFAERWLDDVLDDPEAVAAAVRRNLDEEATRFGIEVDDVAFSNLRAGESSEPSDGVGDGTPA